MLNPKRFPILLVLLTGGVCLISCAFGYESQITRTFTINYDAPAGPAAPRIGFLGGLRDNTPDELIEPLHPSLFRLGHQFRGRISGDLPAAIARVQKLGATYKLVMSDLIQSHPKDWNAYEADVKKLVAKVGDAADSIIWEPANEPDEGYKQIEDYYELYAHAFEALRAVRPKAQICGPSFAFPSYEKYKRFLDDCREHHLECNAICWHYTGWDPSAPIRQKWQLEKMRSFLPDYPELKIREIHCDEWGAGPDKPSVENPGRLQPGRAVVWFHYLQDIYQVDRACRANWGGADDYLGGLITRENQTYPAYYAYAWYGSMAGDRQLWVKGNDAAMAAIASRSAEQDHASASILLGSVAKGSRRVVIELPAFPAKLKAPRVLMLPGTDLQKPIDRSTIPICRAFSFERDGADARITLQKVDENEAYLIQFGHAAAR